MLLYVLLLLQVKDAASSLIVLLHKLPLCSSFYAFQTLSHAREPQSEAGHNLATSPLLQ